MSISRTGSRRVVEQLARELTVSPLRGEIPGYAVHPPGRTSNASQTSEKHDATVSAYRGPDASKLVPAFNYFAAWYLLVFGFLSGQ